MRFYVDVDGTVLTDSDFAPIPALRVNATDTALIFLSLNDIMFLERCDDPWYAATTIIKTETDTSVNKTFYHGDEPARVLGCTERYQFCNPGSETNNSCTPLAGYDTARAAANTVWRTDAQREFFKVLVREIIGIFEIVLIADISSLTAREKLSGGLQGLLANNQWQLDVENWFTASLADLQGRIIEYVTGPTDPAMLQFLGRPPEDARRVCQSVVSSLSPFPLVLSVLTEAFDPRID